jgi:uncharacterized protein (TIGR02270 family)
MSVSHSAAEPFHDLVEESLEEAAFLWRRWENDLSSLTRSLDDVWYWTEDRLHGALDGVLVAGSTGIEAASKGLLSDEIDTVTVSAGLLASSADRRAAEAIAGALSTADGEKLRAMLRGLEVLGSNQALSTAAAVLASRGSAYAGALCRVNAFLRLEAGDEALTALKSGTPEDQADALRAALQVPTRNGDEWITAALGIPDVTVRYVAVETGMVRGIEYAWDAATRRARRLDAHAGPYLKLLAMLGTSHDHETVYAALRIAELQQHAIWALGHIGTVRAAEACLAGMQHENVARACGEAYCWITGADLARDHLEVVETPPDVPAFDEDDLDANLVPSPEALWPLPDPEAARRHWLARRPDFAEDVRHIQGEPVTGDTLMRTIETGPMLRRPDLVLELRVRTRARYDVEPRAFRWRQRQMMAAGRVALSRGGGR